MLDVFTYISLLLSLLAGVAATKNSCRQCLGQQHLTFDHYVPIQVAEAYWKASIGTCATGGEHEVRASLSTDCIKPCIQFVGGKCVRWSYECKNWDFTLKIWRYCGNGGSVELRKANHCADSICTTEDHLTLACSPSVECHGNCRCSECGC